MTWTSFLQSISERHEHALTAHELDVILCLREHPVQSKQELLDTYQQRHSPIEDEAFTQRLRTIYRKFNITGRGYKLPQLHRYLQQQYQQRGQGFGRLGLQTIHPGFPNDRFAAALEQLINADEGDDRQVVALDSDDRDILVLVDVDDVRCLVKITTRQPDPDRDSAAQNVETGDNRAGRRDDKAAPLTDNGAPIVERLEDDNRRRLFARNLGRGLGTHWRKQRQPRQHYQQPPTSD